MNQKSMNFAILVALAVLVLFVVAVGIFSAPAKVTIPDGNIIGTIIGEDFHEACLHPGNLVLGSPYIVQTPQQFVYVSFDRGIITTVHFPGGNDQDTIFPDENQVVVWVDLPDENSRKVILTKCLGFTFVKVVDENWGN